MTDASPAGWRELPLSAVVERLVDGSHNPPPAASSGRAMLSARNVENGRIVFDDFRLIADDDFEREHARTQIRPGDVLLTIVGALGRAAVVPDIEPFTLQRSVAVLRPRDIDGAFLCAQLQAPAAQSWIQANAKGTAQRGVYLRVLGRLPIVVPPLRQQRQIVARLDELKARSARAREALDAVPPLLEKLRQSILAAAFRGDLTKDWRAKHPDVEPASKLLERIRVERRKKWEDTELAKMKAKGKAPAPADEGWRARYKQPEALDPAGLPRLPQGWCWAALDELTLLAGGITKGQRRSPGQQLRSVPYLRVANVQRGHLDLAEVKSIEATESEIAELRLAAGDVLLNEGGDRDKLGRGWVWETQLGECIHQNHVFRARPVLSELMPKYISHYANLHGQRFFVDEGKQTTNLASVSMSRVRRFPVALPPSAEQLALLDRVEQMLAASADIAGTMEAAARQLAIYDRSVLAAAFRGDLVGRAEKVRGAAPDADDITAGREQSSATA